jgi:hypothetical protein
MQHAMSQRPLADANLTHNHDLSLIQTATAASQGASDKPEQLQYMLQSMHAPSELSQAIWQTHDEHAVLHASINGLAAATSTCW